ncbi:hypothetical protein ACI7YT_05580 [Microbacterium sp. M]|uniref:hypothetical protein n=1 Tax=Microbacterium sp. M TaxID=3377125 RepID=UPI003869A084
MTGPVAFSSGSTIAMKLRALVRAWITVSILTAGAVGLAGCSQPAPEPATSPDASAAESSEPPKGRADGTSGRAEKLDAMTDMEVVACVKRAGDSEMLDEYMSLIDEHGQLDDLDSGTLARIVEEAGFRAHVYDILGADIDAC